MELFSAEPLNNATLAYMLAVVQGLLQGEMGQVLGSENANADHISVFDDSNSLVGESSNTGHHGIQPKTETSSRNLSAGIKALIVLVVLFVAGVIAMWFCCRRATVGHVPDSELSAQSHPTKTMATNDDDDEEERMCEA